MKSDRRDIIWISCLWEIVSISITWRVYTRWSVRSAKRRVHAFVRVRKRAGTKKRAHKSSNNKILIEVFETDSIYFNEFPRPCASQSAVLDRYVYIRREREREICVYVVFLFPLSVSFLALFIYSCFSICSALHGERTANSLFIAEPFNLGSHPSHLLFSIGCCMNVSFIYR